MAGRTVGQDRIDRYIELRTQGLSRRAASAGAKVSEKWAYMYEAVDRPMRGEDDLPAKKNVKGVQRIDPIAFEELCPEAKRGLEDFEFFRRFYLGHVSTPWQISTAELVVGLIGSPDKEYLIVNCPPGVGKTTLLHDIACWVTVRDRRIRGLIGSRVSINAKRMLLRIRRTLERTTPAKAPTELIERGLAVDAQACLAQHYGLFKPAANSDLWRAEEFIVAQMDGTPVEEKEPTWSSYGRDSGVLSNRFNVIFWDDLVDRTNCRSAEAIEDLEQHWDTELETRLEPGGLCGLVGQLLSSSDLYHHNAAKTINTNEDGEDISTGQPMYHRVVHRAHDETICQGEHRLGVAKPQPDGCLLDPNRLTWRECRRIKDTKSHVYEVSYQQRDVDPDDVLVPELWVKGGVDPITKEVLPGCWDPKRHAGKIPEGLAKPWISIATADPSPTMWWSIQWWLYHPATQLRYLIDLERRKMDAPDFLDRLHPSGNYVGIMEDWQQRSIDEGAPITTWVVENNAAQRFMLQYDHVKKWMALRGVRIIGHETNRNKSDPNMGVTSLKPHWQHGRVRLPGDPYNGRVASLKLVDEVTKYPNGRTDDCVMAQWFLEWNLPRLTTPDRSNMPRVRRPSWLGRERVPA